MEFSSEQGKSYTCAFCQRGFSNAQALGGHMNIHRRDRAKLRQSFEENLLSMENSSSSMKNTTIDDDHELHHNPLEEKVLFGLEYSGGDQQQKHSSIISGTSSSNYKKYKDDHAIIIQRGKAIGTSSSELLVGMPISSKNEEKKNDDVDLELRLGLEPQHEEPNLSTREFF